MFMQKACMFDCALESCHVKSKEVIYILFDVPARICAQCLSWRRCFVLHCGRNLITGKEWWIEMMYKWNLVLNDG